MLGPTSHTDTFARDNLPPPDQWPDFLMSGFEYPDYMNAAVELLGNFRMTGTAGG